MTLAIHDDIISSDNSCHTAHPAPGHDHAWHVSWLPGRIMDRNNAITAMVLADVGADVHPGHQLWPFVEGWSAELGLQASDALALASQPPDCMSVERDATPEDPEAAGS